MMNRLAQQQDAAKLLQNQPVLAPVPPPPKSVAVPKDLTSALVQPPQWSSLSSPLSASSPVSPPSSQTSMPLNNQQPWIQSTPQNFVNTFPPIPSQAAFNNAGQSWMQPAANNPWSSNKMPSTSTSTSTNSITNGTTAGAQQNWSALDSLLPAVSAQKVSMNQMINQKQPLLQPQNQNYRPNDTNKSSTVLSSDDIMDLLK